MEDNAGALYWRDSSGSAVNCYFEGNSAMNGGAIDAYSDDVNLAIGAIVTLKKNKEDNKYYIV